MKTAINRISVSTHARWSACPFLAHLAASGHSIPSTPGAERGQLIHFALQHHRLADTPLEDLILFDPEALDIARAIAIIDPYRDKDAFWYYEKTVQWSARWKLVKHYHEPAFIRILDRVGFLHSDPETIIVQDTKTGRRFHDNPFERHMSVAAAHFLFPQHTRFRFEYELFGRGSRHFLYILSDPSSIDGRPMPSGFLPRVIQNERRRILMTPPDPTPGPHCDSYFGAPCPFIASLCPLTISAVDTAARSISPRHTTSHNHDSNTSSNYAATALSLALASDDPSIIDGPTMAADLHRAVSHIRAAATHANKLLTAWLTSDTSRSYSINGNNYHPTPRKRFDSAAAFLDLVARGIPLSHIMEAINISPSSLKAARSIPTMIRLDIERLHTSWDTSKFDITHSKEG